MPKTKRQKQTKNARASKDAWVEVAKEEAKYQKEIFELNLREALVVEEEPARNSDGSQYIPSQYDETYYYDSWSNFNFFHHVFRRKMAQFDKKKS